MSGTRLLPVPSYPDLLRTAYAWGRVDGLLAADFEPLDSGGPESAYCRGREAADFARLLWAGPGGEPPAGLEANAAHWYARGFEEALADARADRDVLHQQAAAKGRIVASHRPLERAWP